MCQKSEKRLVLAHKLENCKQNKTKYIINNLKLQMCVHHIINGNIN